MKKAVRVLTILGIVFMVIGIGMFLGQPYIMHALNKEVLFDMKVLYDDFIPAIKDLIKNLSVASWIFYSISGVVLLMFIVHIIIIIAKKKPRGLWVAFFFLIFGAIFAALAVVIFSPVYIVDLWGFGLDKEYLAFFENCIVYYKADSDAFPIYWLIAMFVEIGFAAIGFILLLIADILDMAYLCRSPRAIKGSTAKDAANGNDVVIIRDDAVNGPAPTSEEIRSIMRDEMASKKAVEPALAESEYHGKTNVSAEPSPVAPSSTTAITGPLLVQYINTYSPSSSPSVNAPSDKRGVPLSEIKENVTGEKSLKADDIRKIIKEELDSQKKESSAQPLIVTVPAPANEEEKKEEPKSLSADDIRSIIAEELKSYLKPEPEAEPQIDEDIVVEPVPEPELSADDIRSIIREELAADKKAADEVAAAKKAEEDKRIAEENERKELEARHQKELEEARAKAAEEARKAIEVETRKAAEAEEARKAAEAKAEEEKKNTLTADQIRQIIAEELSRKEEAKPAPAPAPTPAPLSADDIRSIIAEELKSVKTVNETKPAAPVTIIVREPLDRKDVEPAPAKEEPAPAPAPVVVEKPAPEPEPAPEPVPEPEPVEEEEPATEEPRKRAVGEINPNLPPHEKIIRIPFQTRMADIDDDLKQRYNDLKSEIMSYGVKSRVSNSGDTFRLHKVTFVKMTIAGKGLKLYMALDPKDYANTTLPIQDAGHKGTYKDIPLVFKVKSDLSFRRAKQLIADVMAKNNLTQGEVVKRDWIADIISGKSDNDSDED
jgi:hypothetical protein